MSTFTLKPSLLSAASSSLTSLCGFLRTPNLIAIALIANQQRDARFRPRMRRQQSNQQNNYRDPQHAQRSPLNTLSVDCLLTMAMPHLPRRGDAFYSLVVCVFSSCANGLAPMPALFRLREYRHPRGMKTAPAAPTLEQLRGGTPWSAASLKPPSKSMSPIISPTAKSP